MRGIHAFPTRASLTMTIDTPILIAVSALIGVLATAVWNRSTRRFELVYAKKADAYRAFLEKASFLAHTSDTNEHYPDYLMALHSARLIASPKVERALMDNKGINYAIQMLRSGDQQDYGRRERIRSDTIHPAMERIINAMNADLRSQI
jgi:hypothetical protein